MNASNDIKVNPIWTVVGELPSKKNRAFIRSMSFVFEVIVSHKKRKICLVDQQFVINDSNFITSNLHNMHFYYQENFSDFIKSIYEKCPDKEEVIAVINGKIDTANKLELEFCRFD